MTGDLNCSSGWWGRWRSLSASPFKSSYIHQTPDWPRLTLPELFTTQKQKQMTHSDFVNLSLPTTLHFYFPSCSCLITSFILAFLHIMFAYSESLSASSTNKKKKSLEFVMCRSKLPPLFSLSPPHILPLLVLCFCPTCPLFFPPPHSSSFSLSCVEAFVEL